MREEWRPLRHTNISSWLPWFWLGRRFDRSQMDVHFTGTQRTVDTGDPWATHVQRLLCIYWTADSKPYPAQLPYSDNDVQGHTSIIQGACCPEAQGPVSSVITHRALCICVRRQRRENRHSPEILQTQTSLVGWQQSVGEPPKMGHVFHFFREEGVVVRNKIK